jgi:hypothetical protein
MVDGGADLVTALELVGAAESDLIPSFLCHLQNSFNLRKMPYPSGHPNCVVLYMNVSYGIAANCRPFSATISASLACQC